MQTLSDEPPPLTETGRRLARVSEIALVQLLLCFAPWRADPFAVAAAIGLHAARERELLALRTYLLLVGVGLFMDLVYVLGSNPWYATSVGLAQAALKVIVAVPAQKLLGALAPEVARLNSSTLRETIAETVRHVLRDSLRAADVAPAAGTATASTAASKLPPKADDWDQV